MRPVEGRAQLQDLLAKRTWSETTVAFTFIVMVLALTWQQAFVRSVWGYRFLVAICAMGAMTYILRHIFFADGRASRLERGFLAEAQTELALHRIKEATAYRSIPLGPEGPDVDFVVLHGNKLVCIEVKARPFRGVFIRQADHLIRTGRRRAMLLHVKVAQDKRTPANLRYPHSLVVCRSALSFGLLPDGMVWVRGLRRAIDALPDNLTPEQTRVLPKILEELETPA
jgi:hypothetical protein